jgi:enamine deaminase RidA (YjgF/YER057c/UK114 family)
MTGTPHEILHPRNWKPAAGYANGMAATGRMVFTGGLSAGTPIRNSRPTISRASAAGPAQRGRGAGLCGARPEHLVRLTWYVTDKREYLANLKARGGPPIAPPIGRHFPAMALVQVVALVEDRAKVEIEATAVIPMAEAGGRRMNAPVLGPSGHVDSFTRDRLPPRTTGPTC